MQLYIYIYIYNIFKFATVLKTSVYKYNYIIFVLPSQLKNGK